MTEVPIIVVWLAGIFFFVNILFYIAVIYALLFVVKPAMHRMSMKLSELTAKVDKVANRVEELATSVKDTLESVSMKANGILGSVELIAQAASKQFERFSPFIVGAMTAMRLVKSLNEMRHGKTAIEATKKKTLEKKPASPPKKKLFGIF